MIKPPPLPKNVDWKSLKVEWVRPGILWQIINAPELPPQSTSVLQDDINDMMKMISIKRCPNQISVSPLAYIRMGKDNHLTPIFTQEQFEQFKKQHEENNQKKTDSSEDENNS